MATLEDRLALLIAELGNDYKDLSAAIESGGGGSAKAVVFDSDSTYNYLGVASSGTSESSSGWNITRITLPTLISAMVVETATGIWDDRESLTYV